MDLWDVLTLYCYERYQSFFQKMQCKLYCCFHSKLAQHKGALESPLSVPLPNAIGTHFGEHQESRKSPLCVALGWFPVIVARVVSELAHRVLKNRNAFGPALSIDESNSHFTVYVFVVMI